jgi:hypothetical protein
MPDDRRIEPDPRHEGKVTADVVSLIDRETEMNASRFTTRRNYSSLLFVQWQTKLTRKHVRRSARNDSKTCFRTGDALNDLVDRSIAAGDDDFRRSIPSGASSDCRRFMGRRCRSQIDLNTTRS